jgi:hypothetical protein
VNRCTGAIAVVILTTLAPVETQNATVHLQIRETRFTPAGELECVVVNTGTQPITAWSPALSSRGGDGQPTRARRITTDNCMPKEVQVAPLAVVYEDGTAQGDPAQLARVFEARTADRDARGQLLAELRAHPTWGPGGFVWQQAGESLSRSIEQTRTAGADADRALATLIDVVTREYESGVRHAARR